MNRLELVDKIAAENEIPKALAARILKTVTDQIVEAVKNNDPLTILGFGTFKLQERPARVGRNPATGEQIEIAACKLPKFGPGTAFKEAVNTCTKKKCCRKAKK